MNYQQAQQHWPSPDKDWEEIKLPFSIGDSRSEFLGSGQEAKILMRFFRNREENSLNGHIWFSASCFGPPGFVHGGLTAYVLDEALGTTAWMNDLASLALELKINYLKPTPLNRIVTIKSSIDRIEGDHIYLSGEIIDNDRVLSRVEGCFHKIDPGRFLKAASQVT